MTPILVSFSVGDDQWLRAQIRGEAPPAMTVHAVIVQDHAEAERIVGALARLKAARGLPYGGSIRESADRCLANQTARREQEAEPPIKRIA